MNQTFTGRLYTQGTDGDPVQFVLVPEGLQVIDNGLVLKFENMKVEVGGHESDRIKISDTTHGAVLFCSDKRFVDVIGNQKVLGSQFAKAQKKVRTAGFNKIIQWVGAVMILVITLLTVLIAVGGM